jgi:hypothetical protein
MKFCFFKATSEKIRVFSNNSMGKFKLKILKFGVSSSNFFFLNGKNKYNFNHLFVLLIPGDICFVT